METVLGALHGVDYLATHLLLGSVVFYAMILPAGGPAAEALEKRKGGVLKILTTLTFMTSLLWMLLSAVNMTESWAPNEIWAAMSGTSFGHFNCIRIAVLFVLMFIAARSASHLAATVTVFILVLSLPVFSALTGHAAAQPDNTFWHVALVVLHSIAVGVWTGGLWRLHQWLGLRLEEGSVDPEMSHSVVHRFSHFAMASTGVIAATGIVMAYWAGVSIFHPLGTDYGKLVVAKVTFFAVTLGAAAINQFVHLRKWEPTREVQFARSIRREVRLELVLVTFVFLIAGFLARTST
jgi:putative copper resistance protein D